MDIPNIAERIKKIREKRNFSQTFLAQELGISQKAYSKLENGDTKITIDYLFKIANALDVTVNELLNAESFNIYNNYHTHNGEGIVINKQLSEKTVELYEKLIKAKDSEIELLKKLAEKQISKR
jgi:transcriptional regulator with XRE-family HTH domain